MSKPQSKTEKKIDNNLRVALTEVCEQTLKDIPGFQWLTHQANYTNFPASLFITCVFDCAASISAAENQGDTQKIRKRVQARLLKVGIKFKALQQQILFDCEEACEQEDNGDWERRLAGRKAREVGKNRPSC
jgi:hypothetical protein